MKVLSQDFCLTSVFHLNPVRRLAPSLSYPPSIIIIIITILIIIILIIVITILIIIIIISIPRPGNSFYFDKS